MIEADEEDDSVDWKKTNVFVHLRRQFTVSHLHFSTSLCLTC
jgi:hypothetical protein